MSDEKEQEALNPNEFSIGHVGDDKNPTSLLINFPIERYAKEGPEGLDNAYGKVRRIEAIVVMLIKDRFMKNKNGGLVKPIGPLTVA